MPVSARDLSIVVLSNRSRELLHECAETGIAANLDRIREFISLCHEAIEYAEGIDDFSLAIAGEREVEYWSFRQSLITGKYDYRISSFLTRPRRRRESRPLIGMPDTIDVGVSEVEAFSSYEKKIVDKLRYLKRSLAEESRGPKAFALDERLVFRPQLSISAFATGSFGHLIMQPMCQAADEMLDRPLLGEARLRSGQEKPLSFDKPRFPEMFAYDESSGRTIEKDTFHEILITSYGSIHLIGGLRSDLGLWPDSRGLSASPNPQDIPVNPDLLSFTDYRMASTGPPCQS